MKLAAFCAVLTALAPGAAAQETATVEGVVVNKVTGAGIPDVTLWFWSSGTNSYKAVTNDAGVFQVSGLTPGDYSSSVQKSGYTLPDSNQLDPLPQDPPKRHISASTEPVRFRFELIPPAVLRGRVIGPDGNPARAAVELNPQRSVDTGADGSYAFENLTPGAYMLLARPRSTEHASARDEIRTEVVPTYYPSALDRSLAESIAVHPGAELDGYEIRLQSAEVHPVRGIVLDPDGKPAAKAVVQLRAKIVVSQGMTIRGSAGKGLAYSFRTGPVGGQADEQPVITGADGLFEFPSVRMGEWTAEAHSDWIRDEIQHRNFLRFGSAAFRVEHQDPDPLKIQFVTPVSLSVPVTVVLSDGSLPAPGVSVSVTVMSDTASAMMKAPIEPDGVLRFGEMVLPGTSRIQADVEAGNYYVDSLLLGSTDIAGQSVELTPASPPLKIILKPAGTVRGTLEEGDTATVVLFPPGFTGVGYSVQGAGKAFELTGVPPGEYRAIALDRFDPSIMMDAPRLRGLLLQATSVKAEPGSVSSLQLKVNHVPD
ncbi:MAG TPA: carboxypeptidase-like regulatory domain-containing protein [Bryobacteraceae bacterium]|jgi:hypothetical protein|nr:carboxypeptidase-like regulatory domain-containing protein [Bryobacteraceae bacterium]